MSKHEINLIEGNVLSAMIRFSIPILAANLLQSLYSIADMLIVGYFVGQIGLAAISNASMPFFLVTSVSIGFSIGGSVLVAHYKGAGDSKGQTQSVTILLVTMLLLSLLVTLICLIGHNYLFQVMGVPDEAISDANGYTRIVSFGIVFVFGYNAVSSVLRSLGDSFSPLYYALIATTLNIVLDVILVGWLSYGTRGAALATVIAQGVAFFIGLRNIYRQRLLSTFWKSEWATVKSTLKGIVGTGIPYATQMVVVNLSYMIVTGMTNSYGLTVTAAAGVGLKLNTFVAMPCWAVGQAVTSMTAQNMGAKNSNRVRQVVGYGFFCGLMTTGTLVLVIQLAAEEIMLLFGQTDQAFIDAGVWYLRLCCSVNCLFYVAMYIFDSFAVGVGSPRVALVNSLMDSFLLRMPLIWCLDVVFSLGVTGLYLGQSLAPVIPAIIGALFFFRKRWAKQTY